MNNNVTNINSSNTSSTITQSSSSSIIEEHLDKLRSMKRVLTDQEYKKKKGKKSFPGSYIQNTFFFGTYFLQSTHNYYEEFLRVIF